MEKILLINPPFYRLMGSHFNGINLGLSYIASLLSSNGHDISIYNADYLDNDEYINQRQIFDNYDNYKLVLNDLNNPLWKEIESKIIEFKPDIIGLTMLTANYKVDKIIAGIAKKINKDIKIIIGGTHATIDPDNTLKNDEFDYLVRGEGELTFLELIEGKDKKSIKGLSYKQNNKIIQNEKRPFIKDLDILPFPSRDLFINNTKYMDFGNIITGRGCPYTCVFCASQKIWERKVRFRSPQNVIEEIKDLKSKFNPSIIYFIDDTFTLIKSRAKNICRKMIEEKINIPWKCDTRVDKLDYELVNLMKEAGCIRIKIGVETGSENMHNKIKKKLTLDKIRKGVKIIKSVGLPLTVYLMAGFPGETNRDIKDTIEFAKEIDADYYSLSIVAPYLGTEIYDEFIKSGNNIVKEHWEYFYHQSKFMILNNNIDPELIDEFLALNERPGKGTRV
jgi:anaerobic magnesium-protoporphyrin IX monomethyl ester cyclase